MKKSTLVFLVKKEERSVCLGMKKRGFGVGKRNGFGGKVGSDEKVSFAAIRELYEEALILIHPDNLEFRARLQFSFTDNPDWDQEVTVYLVHEWKGEPVETEEMSPDWFNFDQLPFSEMWEDDPYWLPRVLMGEKLEGKFQFGAENKLISHEVNQLWYS